MLTFTFTCRKSRVKSTTTTGHEAPSKDKSKVSKKMLTCLHIHGRQRFCCCCCCGSGAGCRRSWRPRATCYHTWRWDHSLHRCCRSWTASTQPHPPRCRSRTSSTRTSPPCLMSMRAARTGRQSQGHSRVYRNGWTPSSLLVLLASAMQGVASSLALPSLWMTRNPATFQSLSNHQNHKKLHTGVIIKYISKHFPHHSST